MSTVTMGLSEIASVNSNKITL